MGWLVVSWWDQSYVVPAWGRASSLLLALPWGWHPTSKLITLVVGEGQGFDVNPRAGNYGFYLQGLPEAGCNPLECGGYERISMFVDFHRSIYKETSCISKSRSLYLFLSCGFSAPVVLLLQRKAWNCILGCNQHIMHQTGVLIGGNKSFQGKEFISSQNPALKMQIQTCFQRQCFDEISSWVKGWSLRGRRAESSSARAFSICWHSILGAIPTQAPVCCDKIVGLGSGWQNILRHEKMHKQKPCKKRVKPGRSTKMVIAAWGVKGENCAKWYKMLRKKAENWKVTAWQHPGWILWSLWDNLSLDISLEMLWNALVYSG